MAFCFFPQISLHLKGKLMKVTSVAPSISVSYRKMSLTWPGWFIPNLPDSKITGRFRSEFTVSGFPGTMYDSILIMISRENKSVM